MTHEARPPLDLEALETALAAVGRYVNYPATPELGARVLASLNTVERPASRSRWSLARAAAVVAVLLVAIAAGALAISPGAREAVADRLGIGGVTIVELSVTPSIPPAATPAVTPSVERSADPTPPPPPVGAGTPSTVDEARARVPFDVGLPLAMGPPDATYFAPNDPPEGGVTFLWAPRPELPETGLPGVGMLLQEFRGHTGESYFGKGVGPGTTIESVRVYLAPGYSIAGEPHTLSYDGADTERHQHPLRLAGNTLVWVRGGVTYRLESMLPMAEALRIAESIE